MYIGRVSISCDSKSSALHVVARGTGECGCLFFSILNMACSIYKNGFYRVIPTECQSSAEGKVPETQQCCAYRHTRRNECVVSTRVNSRLLSDDHISSSHLLVHINTLKNSNIFFLLFSPKREKVLNFAYA